MHTVKRDVPLDGDCVHAARSKGCSIGVIPCVNKRSWRSDTAFSQPKKMELENAPFSQEQRI